MAITLSDKDEHNRPSQPYYRPGLGGIGSVGSYWTFTSDGNGDWIDLRGASKATFIIDGAGASAFSVDLQHSRDGSNSAGTLASGLTASDTLQFETPLSFVRPVVSGLTGTLVIDVKVAAD